VPDLSIEKLQLFLLIVFPGIIALKVYNFLQPSEKRDFGSSILEAAAYGLLNFALVSGLLIYLNSDGFPQRHPWLYMLGSAGPLLAQLPQFGPF